MLDPSLIESWSEKHYASVLPIATEVVTRTPLIVSAGDVGTGKTELAETFPDVVARQMGIDLTLFPLSLAVRGRGAVGEMTALLTAAFEAVAKVARSGRNAKGRLRAGAILFIDEADALAQSRELEQMHHEDRAGVNALVRGIDSLRGENLPVLTIMATNRESALDAAVSRRAAAVLRFARPDDAQRRELLKRLLEGTSIGDDDLAKLVQLTGPSAGKTFGCTFSDLRQRFMVEAVLDTLDDGPLVGSRLVTLAEEFVPTPPFGAENV